MNNKKRLLDLIELLEDDELCRKLYWIAQGYIDAETKKKSS